MDARTLAKLYALDGPFVTLYLGGRGDTEDAAKMHDLRWKNVLRRLADEGVDDATCAALEKRRGDHASRGTQVLVAAHGVVHLNTELPELPFEELVSIGQLPRLVPLLDALGRQLPHVVVLVDRTGADVLAYTAGPDPADVAEVRSDRWPLHHTGMGGWATKRYDQSVQKTWDDNARDVADAVARIAGDTGARVVVAAGDVRALQLLGEHLPAAVSDKLVTIGGGGRHLDGSDTIVGDRIAQALADAREEDTAALLDAFAQERGQHDRAADGIDPAVAALARAQVATLLLTEERDAEQAAYFGPDPTHLALTPEALLDLGVEQPWQAPLDEVLVRAALGTGAEVRFVTGGMPQSPSDGVGALLRYGQ